MRSENKLCVVGPVSRIEGHLEFYVELEGGAVKEAFSSGALFRGIENLLAGKDPRDALLITPRICGVCPASHAMASVKALDDAFAAEVPENALLVRNVILASETLMSHLTHFYALWAPDLADQKYSSYPGYQILASRFAPLAGSSYLAALRVRTKPHELIAILGGKMPHSVSHIPGGVTVAPALNDLTKAYSIWLEIRAFVEQTLLGCDMHRWLENRSLQDVEKWLGEDGHAQSDLGLLLEHGRRLGLDSLGAGCGRFLSYGVYDRADGGKWLKSGFYDGRLRTFDPRKITEHVKHSWYADYEGGKSPSEGVTEPEFAESGEKYSWIKAPRYEREVVEVGPLARMVCDGDPLVLDLLGRLGPSVYTRTLARLHEGVRVLAQLKEWLLWIDPAKPFYKKAAVPRTAQGMGLTEAPRGALGHWVDIKGRRIRSYQVIPPTVWNASPRDSAGSPGAMEQAAVGTKVSGENDLLGLQHIIRSFDPCLACAVHCGRVRDD